MGLEVVTIDDIDIKEGDEVRVINGALENFFGVVEGINAERQKVMNEIKTEYVNDPSCLSFIFQGEEYFRPQPEAVEKRKENEQLILPEAVAIPVSEENIPESEIATAVEVEEAPKAEQLSIESPETAE